MANTVDTMLPEVILRKIIDGTLDSFEDDTSFQLADRRLSNHDALNELMLTGLTQAGTDAFTSSKVLKILYIPNCVGFPTSYSGLLSGTAMKIISFPSTGNNTPAAFLNGNKAVTTVDLGPGLANIGGNWASGASNFNTLILRRSASLVAAANGLDSNVFGGDCPFHSGKSGGTIYIPKVLYDHLDDGSSLDYYSATNWSAAKNNSAITFASIEGSKFEYIYADGSLVDENVGPSSISVTFTSPDVPLYAGMNLRYLRDTLTVNATFGQLTFEIPQYYTLEGELAVGTNTITVRYYNKTATFTATAVAAPVLPSGYTLLRSIYSDGNSYFNTNIGEDQLFYAEYAYKETARSVTGAGHVLSSNNIYYPKCFSLSAPATIQTRIWGTETSLTLSDWALGTLYRVTADYEGNRAVTVNGTSLGTGNIGTNKNANNKLHMFTYGGSPGTAANRLTGNIYYMRLYQNNVLVHNFVPCRNENGVVGMYDVPQSAFFRSDTTTDFIAD